MLCLTEANDYQRILTGIHEKKKGEREGAIYLVTIQLQTTNCMMPRTPKTSLKEASRTKHQQDPHPKKKKRWACTDKQRKTLTSPPLPSLTSDSRLLQKDARQSWQSAYRHLLLLRNAALPSHKSQHKNRVFPSRENCICPWFGATLSSFWNRRT